MGILLLLMVLLHGFALGRTSVRITVAIKGVREKLPPPMAVRTEPNQRKDEQCCVGYEELMQMQMQVTRYRSGWIEVLHFKVVSEKLKN